ncbi:FAD-dependent oxidoreductase [Nocardiopsis gilva YIM 90087]|uniref:FAD-dependent oxidoreductase n=1 Tax=Nocardiopsis gilva YIM 90087 TaxID=1235441 RepID=A0A223S0E5_9ACTN|nr:FAD-dependent oxidoreductase [Nocardiopsis gilva]ASU81601.1 FAD-dependent oxidoreductase [Nocardiopsis gilva YIM 90087]
MSEIYEAVVVGAGMFGSAAAKYLGRAGANVLVIGPAEPDDKTNASIHAFGAHYDEARITRRMGWDAVWGTIDAKSLDRFQEVEEESGIRFSHECGSLALVAKSIPRRTESMLRQCDNDGIAVERKSADDLPREFPGLGLPALATGVEGLLERDQAGYLNPRQLIRAQLRLARTAGARLLRAAVTAVHREDTSGVWRLHIEGDSGRRQIRAERVLVATGAVTSHNNVLPEGSRLALHAFTEPNLLFEVSGTQLKRFQSLPTVVTVDPEETGDANMSSYMLPPVRYPDGRWYMRIGPGMQPFVEELTTVDDMVGWYSRQEVTSRQSGFLVDMMRMLAPDMKPTSVRPACCIIEKTSSTYPYIGHIDADESFSVVIGGNGHGARGSDEIGRLASTVVLDQAWDSPLPREVFTPITASADTHTGSGRPSFHKPPFGLC